MCRMNLGQRYVHAIAVVLGLLGAQGLPAEPGTGGAEFTGSAACRECHERFYQLWAPSHHGLAMQPYSIAKTNLTKQITPVTVRSNSYQVRIDEALVVEGGPGGEKRYKMEHALGGKNVLYFLTP